MAAPTGYSSLGLIGFTDKGDYAADTTYMQNDLVHDNGKIWKSKVDNNTGHTPASGTYWEVWIDAADNLSEMQDVTISSVANGDVLEYDSTSSKWVNSDTLSTQKQALSNEVVTRATLGAHNILPYPYSQITGSYSYNGITYKANSDGSVKLTGSSSALSSGMCHGRVPENSNPMYLPKGRYIASLVGADSSKYYCEVGVTYNGNYSSLGKSENTINNEVEFEISASTNADFKNSDGSVLVAFYIMVKSTNNVSIDTTVYPMLRLATDENSNFTPYVPTNSQLLSYKDNGVLGAKNFAAGKFTAGVNNGITYIANANDSVSFSGTIGSQDDYSLADSAVFTLKAGTYILSSNPVPGSGTHRSTVRLFISGGSSVVTLSTETEGTFTLASDSNVYIRIAFNGTGESYSGTFYPMIRLASDTDPTYQPYAKSNKELTDEEVQPIVGVSEDIASATAANTAFSFTPTEDGWYSVVGGAGETAGDITLLLFNVGQTVRLLAMKGSVSAWDSLVSPPIFLKGGTTYKAIVGYPSGGSGKVIRLT